MNSTSNVKFSNDAPYHNAQKQYDQDAENYGSFTATKPSKADKGRYFYNDRVTWFLSGRYATRKDEKTGLIEFYYMDQES